MKTKKNETFIFKAFLKTDFAISVLGGGHKYVETIVWYMDGQKDVNL